MTAFNATAPCSERDPEEGNTLTRGLVVETGPDGQPVIRVVLFRTIEQGGSGGKLAFDMTALSKVQAQLAGASEHSEYSMAMSNAQQALAPEVQLHGVYKRVRVIAESVPYGDLADTGWECVRPALDLDEYNKKSMYVHRPGMNPDVYTAAHLEISACSAGTRRVSGSVRDMRLVPEINDVIEQHKTAFLRCDPSGHLQAAFAYSYGDGTVRHSIKVFSASGNPLYPAPDYFHEWSGRELKSAFQIYWLIAKQKARSAAK